MTMPSPLNERITQVAAHVAANRDHYLALWQVALTSGAYQQAHGCLRTEIGHCCLGVFADLLAADGHGEWDNGHCFLGDENLLPHEIFGALRICPITPDPNPDSTTSVSGQLCLSANNDAGKTFAEIAALIKTSMEQAHAQAI